MISYFRQKGYTMSTARPIHDDQNAGQSDQSQDDIKPVRGHIWRCFPAVCGRRF